MLQSDPYRPRHQPIFVGREAELGLLRGALAKIRKSSSDPIFNPPTRRENRRVFVCWINTYLLLG
jgi:hypothetical protein